MGEFAAASLGVVTVANVELAARPGGARLSFTHRGAAHSWDIDDDGDWYDLYTVWEIAPVRPAWASNAKCQRAGLNWPDRVTASCYPFLEPHAVALRIA